jgi:hypothetical protein
VKKENPGQLKNECPHGYDGINKNFLDKMGVEVQAGDEVEITVKILTRVVTRREPVE